MFVLICLGTILLILLTSLIWWYLNVKKIGTYLDTIPGPTPLPIIGNSNLVGTTTVSLLQSFMKVTEEYGPVMKLWLGPRLHLLISDAQFAEFFFNTNEYLDKSDGYDLFRPWLGDGLLVSTGRKWRTRRKMITGAFHFKILEEFLEVFNAQVNVLLDKLYEKAQKTDTSFNIHEDINLCSLDIICETAFGTSINAQFKSNPKYVEAVTGFLEIFTMRFFSAWKRNPILFRLSSSYKVYKDYLKILHEFTNNIIIKRREEFKLRKKNPTSLSDDGIKRKQALLDMLLDAAENDDSLTDSDIREEVDTFMFEGHDTASTAICFTLYALATNPEVQKKLYEELINVLGPDSKKFVSFSDIQELKYLDLVVKEAERLYPPVPLIERGLHQDCTIGSITIPKGTNISIFLYGMHHSPKVFPNPQKFDPERFLPEGQSRRHPYDYVPFSAGPRNCIGQKFAQLELKTTIAKLLRKFELIEDPTFVPEIGMCSVLKTRNGFVMKLKTRNK